MWRPELCAQLAVIGPFTVTREVVPRSVFPSAAPIHGPQIRTTQADGCLSTTHRSHRVEYAALRPNRLSSRVPFQLYSSTRSHCLSYFGIKPLLTVVAHDWPLMTESAAIFGLQILPCGRYSTLLLCVLFFLHVMTGFAFSSVNKKKKEREVSSVVPTVRCLRTKFALLTARTSAGGSQKLHLEKHLQALVRHYKPRLESLSPCFFSIADCYLPVWL